MKPIDVVYTWVDGSEAGYAQVRNEWARRCGRQLNPERDRDDIPFLRFSLRALERFAPWFRYLYLVTARPQCPDWINPDHPRLRWVHHDEFFRFQDSLPTYNSNAIDWNLAHLPDLAPHFWYFNDDYLLGRKVKPSHLLSAEGRVRVYLPKSLIPTPESHGELDAWASILYSTQRALDQQLGPRPRAKHEHTPMLIPTETAAALGEDGPIRETLHHRFRLPDDIALETFLSHFLLEKGLGERVPAWEYKTATSFHRLDNDLPAFRKVALGLRLTRPRFYCLNDDMGANPDPAYMAAVLEFLQSYYPHPSSFER